MSYVNGEERAGPRELFKTAKLSERSPLAEYRRYPYGSLYKSYPYYASARRSAKVLTFDVDYDIINSSINKNLTEKRYEIEEYSDCC